MDDTTKIPAGYYKGRAVAGSEQFGVTPNGTDQLVLDVDLPSLGRRVSTILYFSTNAAPYSLEKLRACGWIGDDVTDLKGIDANEITLEVKYETYDGKERMKTNISTGGGRITLDSPMDAATKRGFAARMRALAKGAPVAPQTSAPKPAPVAPEAPEDEDPIPF